MPYDEEDVLTPSIQHNQNLQIQLQKRMHLDSREATVSTIKQYHINNGYMFMVWNWSLTHTQHDASIIIMIVNGV